MAPAVLRVAIKSIEDSRQMRYQSINAYRKRFNMKPYKSFEDMTGKGLLLIYKLMAGLGKNCTTDYCSCDIIYS